MGTLSHVVNHAVLGYNKLPDFPEEDQPRELRDETVFKPLLVDINK